MCGGSGRRANCGQEVCRLEKRRSTSSSLHGCIAPRACVISPCLWQCSWSTSLLRTLGSTPPGAQKQVTKPGVACKRENSMFSYKKPRSIAQPGATVDTRVDVLRVSCLRCLAFRAVLEAQDRDLSSKKASEVLRCMHVLLSGASHGRGWGSCILISILIIITIRI